jgi:predicted phosphohydrolase
MKKLFEKAPPGKKYEKLVLNLKKKYGETSERPFAIAWSIYNKNHEKKKNKKNDSTKSSHLGLTTIHDQLLAENLNYKQYNINSFFSRLNESVLVNPKKFFETFIQELIHYFGSDNIEDITNYKEEDDTIAELTIRIPELTDELYWLGVYPNGKIIIRSMIDGWSKGLIIFKGQYTNHSSIFSLMHEIEKAIKYRLNESVLMNPKKFFETFIQELIHYFGSDNIEDITNYKEEDDTIAELTIRIPELTDELYWLGIYPDGKIIIRSMIDGWSKGLIFKGQYTDDNSIFRLVYEIEKAIKRHAARL